MTSINKATKAPHRSFTAGECAQLVVELCSVAATVKAQGYCMGPLNNNDLYFNGSGLCRAPTGRWKSLLNRFRANIHHRLGHGVGCAELGVAKRYLMRCVSVWLSTDFAVLIEDAVDQSIEELSKNLWLDNSSAESISFAISQRISPEQLQ